MSVTIAWEPASAPAPGRATTVAAAMSALMTALDSLLALEPHALAEPVLVTAVEQAHLAESRVRALQARLVQATDACEATVAERGRTTRSHLIESVRLSPRTASARLMLARALPSSPEVAAALGSGRITGEHAEAICRLLRDVPPHLRDVVTTELLGLAERYPASLLWRAIRAIRDRLGLDDDADERTARRHGERHVNLDETIDGYGSLTGLLTPELREALDVALCAAMNRSAGSEPEDHERSARQQRHDALADIIRSYLAHAPLPAIAGERPRVTVTIDFRQLLDRLEAAPGDTAARAGRNEGVSGLGTFGSGVPVSATTARRLACDAEVLPVVLGGDGEVLDLGRARRTFSLAIRRAAWIRDRGRCAFPSCSRAPAECHHIRFWADGGASSVDNAAWLCAFHHWLVHEGGWSVRRGHDAGYMWRGPRGQEIRPTWPPAREGPARHLQM